MRLFILALALLTAVCLLPTAARAACSGPAGVAGQILSNGDHSVLQYCNGAAWYAIGK